MPSTKRQKIVVVGAGPVGALTGLYAAQRGYEVEVYELRGDIRDPTTTPLNFTRSINLALSERGVNAIHHAGCPGLLDSILDATLPMHGRMIHGLKKGELFEQSQLYDVHGRYIRAADRAGLNKSLLDELEKMPNVKLFFNHKLTGADFQSNRAWFEQKQASSTASPSGANPARALEVERSFDLMIGTDGAHSAVRFHLMKFARMSYQQEYIDTLWCEFHIAPSKKDGGFRLAPDRLHIWPAGSFMFIAIPSKDHSFTCTLFMPAARFDELSSNKDSLIPFFEQNFPGVVPDLIRPSDLQTQYTQNPHLPLISIKCTPYHFASSAVILGDAAHAMVPFYGQGMNAGLEDVRVLFSILDAHSSSPSQATVDSAPITSDQPFITKLHSLSPESRAHALRAYTAHRTPDAHSINDLAMGNYVEMRSSVRSPTYLLRKYVEELLDVWAPSLGFATQYSRVSFGNDRYSSIVEATAMQGRVLRGLGWGLVGVFGLCIGGAIWTVRARARLGSGGGWNWIRSWMHSRR